MTKTEITKILLEYDSGEISTDKAIEKLSDLLSTDKEAEAVGVAHKIGEAILKKQYEIYTPLRKMVVEVPEIIYEFDKEGVDILPKIDF